MDNRKWLTMDGNEAAEERTSSERPSRSQRCSLKPVLQALSTAPLQQVL